MAPASNSNLSAQDVQGQPGPTAHGIAPNDPILSNRTCSGSEEAIGLPEQEATSFITQPSQPIMSPVLVTAPPPAFLSELGWDSYQAPVSVAMDDVYDEVETEQAAWATARGTTHSAAQLSSACTPRILVARSSNTPQSSSSIAFVPDDDHSSATSVPSTLGPTPHRAVRVPYPSPESSSEPNITMSRKAQPVLSQDEEGNSKERCFLDTTGDDAALPRAISLLIASFSSTPSMLAKKRTREDDEIALPAAKRKNVDHPIAKSTNEETDGAQTGTLRTELLDKAAAMQRKVAVLQRQASGPVHHLTYYAPLYRMEDHICRREVQELRNRGLPDGDID
ncbi:hypothetical protein CALVIDRAFT_594620 [Calocera viscosa TUFC12733]|uniref:Uncharacterized protein n=1 Tax=Calocera viscosa (strain TUFC12733) TaxID=1330018 RepID=A0A167RN06_CALVF|nr:hypothetical protein CALVIDRAFT_594620 [Calocera viscosa TUFC12733]